MLEKLGRAERPESVPHQLAFQRHRRHAHRRSGTAAFAPTVRTVHGDREGTSCRSTPSRQIDEAEDSRLLTSLTHMFGKSISSDELIDAADGSGYKLLELHR